MCPPATISATRLMELLAPTLGWDKSSETVSVALARRGQSHGELSIEEALALLDALSQSPGLVGIAARFVATRLSSTRPATEISPRPELPPEPAEPLSRRMGPSSARSPRASAPPPSGGAPPISVSAPSSTRARPVGSSRSGAALAAASGQAVTTLELREIIALFESAMGREKSEEVVVAAARRIGLHGEHTERAERTEHAENVDHAAHIDRAERIDRAQALALVDSLAGEAGMVGLCARFAKARLILRFAA
ncbi:MAG: hypothetical protein QM820_28595 [Minicystis sp.]